MTKDYRLNIRLESKLAAEAKRYAKRNHTSVSCIIEKHLRALMAEERTAVAVTVTGEAEQV